MSQRSYEHGVGRTCALVLAAALLVAFILPNAASAATQTLTVEKPGTGTGTVTSSPAGIECGATCSAPFTEGASVALSALPGPNSTEVAWTGCSEVTIGNECKVTMSAAKTVKATFNLQQRQLTVEKKGSGTGTVTSEPAGISCGGTCAVNFTKGTLVTLSATPDASSQAPSWSGCDSISEGKCTVTMNTAKTVSATFALTSHQLTVSKAGEGAASSTITSSPAGIECGASCAASYTHGTVVTLTGTPGPHVKAAQWSGCGSVNGENKCLVTMNEAKAVSATFDLEAGYAFYAVTVQRTGNGQGTVTGSPGSIDCGTACTAQLLTGTSISLTATPAKGSVFTRWSGGGCKGAGPCTTTVKGAKTIKALFKLSGQRTLSVQKVGSGSGTVKGKAAGVNCGSACSSQIAAGKKVTLSAKAASGSSFVGWSGACTGAAKTCKVTMTEARSVTATFSGGSASAPPPLCVVPRLRGKSPRKARAALAAAHCALGRVSKPKAKKGRKLGPLVVKSFSPGAGTVLPAGGKVDLKLKRVKKKLQRRR